MRTVTDHERRARLARRHALAPTERVGDAVAATRAVTVLHATEPATVALSLQARVADLARDDVRAALEVDRTLVKQLAMRRTLFVFPRDLLPASWGSASARVATQQRGRLAREVVAGGLAADGEQWVAQAGDAVVALLAERGELQAAEVRAAVPALDVGIEVAPGTAYGGTQPVVPRLLTLLGLEARVVRGTNAGHWRVSRHRWALAEDWLGEQPAPWDERAGWAELVRRWLRSHGPGTAADLQWWLGSTKTAVTRALGDVDAVEVRLEDGRAAWLLPDDLAVEPDVAPWAALLPVLDPTTMGWKERDAYLGPHAAAVFDRNGNAGTTAWWNGRVVGVWVQDDAGRVVVSLLEDVPPTGRAALAVEAERLTAWLDGERVGTVYPSPAMRAALA
ncbi:hypothetical protein BJ989_002800 [Nocardioides perillae]|uniref:Winged helix DNA-binding domain-containing protein n=1 Tax=Nocardioides perillae TaxID=1119534 RepID=A0A7Y9RTT3_9ACTN|nr:hypothetical protein [Nocardioides perillae]